MESLLKEHSALVSPPTGCFAEASPETMQKAGLAAASRCRSPAIQIIQRSTSVPGQLHDFHATLACFNDDTSHRPAGEFNHRPGAPTVSTVGRSRGPAPGAPLMVGSLPPVWILEDMPSLVLPPQAGSLEEEGLGSLSASYSRHQQTRMGLYASSCPAALHVWPQRGVQQEDSSYRELGHHQDSFSKLSSGGGFMTSLVEEDDVPAGIVPDDDCYASCAPDSKSSGGGGGGTPGSLTVLGFLEALSRRSTSDDETVAQGGSPGITEGAGSLGAAFAELPQVAVVASAASENMFQMEEDEESFDESES
ncbi:hypothetical protein JKP88DRAFT_306833 [Tribonema minus]|uniref:Uncharacterized protein n=1 Tax=Tribonema minus TaxID=303371 RepID=A0A835ZEV1_9STRA|nr:hypothetical protein JKP88DRAFT_306833 [Tribonema minus]